MKRIRLYFRWYDLWIGAYYDRMGLLYVQPLPCIGVCISLNGAPV